MPRPTHNPLSPQEYERLLHPLLRKSAGFARSIVRTYEDAQDAVQQAALRGLQRLTTYDPSRSFEAWWFTILRHCCIDLLRSRPRNQSLDVDQVDLPDARSGGGEDWEELAMALEQLGPQHAEILRLKYFAGLSYRDLSQALDIPLGTVMSRLHEARKHLAAQMCKGGCRE